MNKVSTRLSKDMYLICLILLYHPVECSTCYSQVSYTFSHIFAYPNI